MRQLVIWFILSFNSLQEQTITVFIQNSKGETLEGVSVFDIDSSNKLVAISDINGRLNLLPEKKYSFHLLGYKDSVVSTSVNLTRIALQNVIYGLPEVKIGSAKTKIISLIERADWLPGLGIGIGGGLFQGGVSQKLTSINIPKSGFLKGFSLIAHNNGEGKVEGQLNFLLYDNNNGLPGKILMETKIPGGFKNNRLYFNFEGHSIYIPIGNYFIGYEINNSNASLASKMPVIRNGSIIIDYRKTQNPELFTRNNLSKWVPFTWTNPHGEKKSFYSFGYELEMDIRAND